jgi:molybdopterin molybdotransferase
MRPGKPLLYGRLGAQRVLGVPGNPISAYVSALLFLVPMLERMQGLPAKPRSWPEAILASPLQENGEREHYVGAVSEWQEEGTRLVRPLPSQDSSLVAGLARADCLIVRAPHAPALARGSRVKIVILDGD